jgi:hypothetical protein
MLSSTSPQPGPAYPTGHTSALIRLDGLGRLWPEQIGKARCGYTVSDRIGLCWDRSGEAGQHVGRLGNCGAV